MIYFDIKGAIPLFLSEQAPIEVYFLCNQTKVPLCQARVFLYREKVKNEMTIELGVLISILGLVIAYQSYHLNKQKQQFEQMKLQMEQQKDVKLDTRNDAKESAELKAELGYIRRGVDDIKIDLKANEKQMQALGERVTRVEESAKQAHKRLDNMDKESV